MVKGAKRWSIGLLVVGLFSLGSPVYAELQSPNYRLEEGAIGTGGSLQSSSSNFKADSSTGTLGVGSSASASYEVGVGAPTTPDPRLSFEMNTSTASFGTFTAASASTATASFSVLNYTSYGYVVQLVGTPPKNSNTTLTALASGGTSNVGNEQFGVNLVANTSPTSIGANPVQDYFGLGVAAPNYSTPNTYRFVSGETIASAPKSSGKTTYTMSYLVNVSPLTAGGVYTSNQTLVITGTY